MSSKLFLTICSLALCSLVLEGCEIPMALSMALAGSGSREQKFETSVKTLHTAVQWGTPMTANEVVSPELLPTFYTRMIPDPKRLKVVDITVGDIQLDMPGKDQAITTADIRVYGPPYYSVRTLTRKETWQYSGIVGNWQLIGLEEMPSSDDQQ